MLFAAADRQFVAQHITMGMTRLVIRGYRATVDDALALPVANHEVAALLCGLADWTIPAFGG
jgi:hypothetical protein